MTREAINLMNGLSIAKVQDWATDFNVQCAASRTSSPAQWNFN
jgi:hypothetical protein